jgi:hypothetical protein
MGALLTVTHLDGIRERYSLECAHGMTTDEGDARSLDARQKLIANLMARHGTPYGCNCSAETDLLEAYPSIDSAVEQLTYDEGAGFADMPDDVRSELIESVRAARCEACSVAILVLPFREPLVVAPLHDVRCPFATVGPEAGSGRGLPTFPGSPGGAFRGRP